MTALTAAILLLAACGCAAPADTSAPPVDAAPGAGAGVEAAQVIAGEVTVFAAASLTDAFEQIGVAFEQAHPDATVRINVAGSQQLATQIIQGAPADVFASANTAQMEAVVDAGAAAGAPITFAGNVLEIAVEPGNPRGIATLADLGRDDLAVVLAAEQVPAGRYARQALDAAGVPVAPVSLEADVRAVVSKVSLGEADAGIVYASDIAAAGDRVTGVEIPAEHNVTATYPIVLLADAPNPDAGQAWIDMVIGPTGQRALRAAGFTVPASSAP